MKAIENEVLQFLLGETHIDADKGYYTLDIQENDDEIHVTVDYHNEDAHASMQHSCMFNETYSISEYGENPFSIEQLSMDLHAQHLEKVDDWVVSYAESKGWGSEEYYGWKVFDSAKVGKYEFAILLDEENKEAYEAIKDENGEWETDFSFAFLDVTADDVVQVLDYDEVRKKGYKFVE